MRDCNLSIFTGVNALDSVRRFKRINSQHRLFTAYLRCEGGGAEVRLFWALNVLFRSVEF
jgi:hypothetical protein